MNQTPSQAESQAMALAGEKESELRVRNHGPFLNRAVSVLAVTWALFQLYATVSPLFTSFSSTLGLDVQFPAMDAIRLRAWHILFLLTLSTLMYPFWPRTDKGRLPPAADLFFLVAGCFFLWYAASHFEALAERLGAAHIAALCALAVLVMPVWKRWLPARAAFDLAAWLSGCYAFGDLLLKYNEIVMRGGYFLPADYFAALLGVLSAFFMAWRVVGNLAWLAAVFMAYAMLGQYLPGPLGHAGFSWPRIVEHMFWGTQGLLGVGVGVSATYIFLFVLFGSFLKYSGFSEFINDLALTLVGRTAGGPAKVSVIASALMGMINGSALANVATTGAITIPLMKRTGYRAEFAGAVEAVASTGGQFAPPIMGAVGFIMAEFLGVSYTQVMLAAAIPAFLYYLGLLMAVHFEARKLGLKGLAAENIPRAAKVLASRGHLLIPLVLLVVVLFMGYTPLYAASLAILATVAASWLSPQTRMTPRLVFKALDEGARGAVGVGAACVIIGVIIGTVSLTGLGLKFGFEVLKFVKPGQLYLGGVFVMVMSVILGMGVPGVAAYVIVAAVAVPVMINVGASPMASHMFCLFYACLSNITPPVAMSSYVAAGIARSDQTRTSLIAVKLGLSGFILPFFFLDNPLLLYSPDNDTLLTVWALLSASLGVTALAAGLQGWLWGPCNALMRVMLLLTAGLAIDPSLYTDAIGLALFLAVLAMGKLRQSRN